MRIVRPFDIGAHVRADVLIDTYKAHGIEAARALYEQAGQRRYNADQRLANLAKKGLVEFRNFKPEPEPPVDALKIIRGVWK